MSIRKYVGWTGNKVSMSIDTIFQLEKRRNFTHVLKKIIKESYDRRRGIGNYDVKIVAKQRRRV